MGCFFVMRYTKPTTTLQEQIQILRQRGLLIPDVAEAEHFLSNVSYYRLAGYWWPMQSDKVRHIFKPGSRFENVISLYNFDRELRVLLFDVIERIEIGLRTRLIYHLSHEFGPWWFEDASHFKNPTNHAECLNAIDRELQQSKDTFIREHYRKYHADGRRPPAWKTLEVVSFTTLSKLYANLLPAVKSKDLIAKDLNTVNHTYLQSWLQSIAQIRNICAHHGRLWNKNLPGRPKLLSRPPAAWLVHVPPVTEHHKLYVHLCCMKYMLDVVDPANHFSSKLTSLLVRYPTVDARALGMRSDWRTELLWRE